MKINLSPKEVEQVTKALERHVRDLESDISDMQIENLHTDLIPELKERAKILKSALGKFACPDAEMDKVAAKIAEMSDEEFENNLNLLKK